MLSCLLTVNLLKSRSLPALTSNLTSFTIALPLASILAPVMLFPSSPAKLMLLATKFVVSVNATSFMFTEPSPVTVAFNTEAPVTLIVPALSQIRVTPSVRLITLNVEALILIVPFAPITGFLKGLLVLVSAGFM